jgi:hypothetical protein
LLKPGPINIYTLEYKSPPELKVPMLILSVTLGAKRVKETSICHGY